MMKIFLLFILASLQPVSLPAQEDKPLAPRQAQEARPSDAAAEAAAVRDRIMTSLFFRGEVADKILDSGEADTYVDLSAFETHAEARSALLDWIRKNPAKAAEIYLSLKYSGGRPSGQTREVYEISWKFNPSFLAAVKALNAAAGSSTASREVMELAARRLYEGQLAEAEAPPVIAGGAGGRSVSRKDFADYRLNKGALDAELSRAAGWMEAARLEAARPGVEQAYASAFAIYQEFLVAASALKGRGVLTAKESVRLEELRSRLRAALGLLSMRARVSALDQAAVALASAAGEPGATEMLAAVKALKAELEQLAALGESGAAVPAKDAVQAENKFAGLYLGYSAYDGLLNLKRRAARPAFSCLLDYAAWRWLASFAPGSPYPKARTELEAAAAALDQALALAGSGNLEGALTGLDAGRLEAAAGAVSSASAFNRAAQFYSWGLFFRPVELKVTMKGGRPVFRPAFTLSEVARGR